MINSGVNVVSGTWVFRCGGLVHKSKVREDET